ncbi:4-hydroxytryptamine kinase [Paramyrothecium foliicola]|nr:4-hydroxytryptamine kinase [Paramyrothecium foliicola]
MTITTNAAVRQYLDSKNIKVVDVTTISGGTSNYIWRITGSQGQTRILKHAEPHLSANTSIPFPLERMNFEAQALAVVPHIMAQAGVIRCPKVILHDRENHVLILEDVGQKTLKDIYQDPRLSIEFVGKSIGRWLAQLHASTTANEVKDKFNHTVAKQMYRWNYNSLSSTLERFGYEAALGERINEKYGSLLQTDNMCLCHTDMWPGNILFDLKDDNWPQELSMAVIDWEVARQGNGVTDVGHFAGEAWFLDHWRGRRGLLGAFLKAYVQERSLSLEDKQRVAAQFGTHITHWSTIYVSVIHESALTFAKANIASKDWLNEQETIESVSYGKEILKHVDEEDWDWFKGGDLGILFHL